MKNCTDEVATSGLCPAFADRGEKITTRSGNTVIIHDFATIAKRASGIDVRRLPSRLRDTPARVK
jgi:hypothetical protein